MGPVVGIAHAVVQVRSPAPPLIALVGLLGMVLGEQVVDIAKRHFASPAQSSIHQPSGDAHTPKMLKTQECDPKHAQDTSRSLPSGLDAAPGRSLAGSPGEA
jgi:XapX domain-containing protein